MVTFLKYIYFPIRKHSYHRIIFGCQTVGKEDVLVEAARLRQVPIYVEERVRKIYEVLGLDKDLLTTDQEESVIWQESLRHVTEFDLKTKNRETPTIAIVLTASGLLYSSAAAGPRTRGAAAVDKFIFTVRYSNHCSASELAKFLNFLQPINVVRIVDPPPGNKKSSSGQSVIDLYVAGRKEQNISSSAEMSSDMEEATVGSYDELFIQQQQIVPDELMDTSFQSAEDDDIPQTASVNSAGYQTPDSQPSTPAQPSANEKAIAQATAAIRSINAELDAAENERIIYSTSFMSKLMALAGIYEPLTGISFQPD